MIEWSDPCSGVWCVLGSNAAGLSHARLDGGDLRLPRRPAHAVRLGAIVAVVIGAGSSSATAASFECTLDGLGQAFQAAIDGDPGPHDLLCSSGDTIVMDPTWVRPAGFNTHDIDLDANGGAIECQRSVVRHPPCYPAFVFRPPLICVPPDCPEAVYGPPPAVALRNVRFITMGLEARQGADLTLDRAVVEYNDWDGSTLNRPGAGLWLEDPRGIADPHARVIDSTIHHGIQVTQGSVEIDRSTIFQFSASTLTFSLNLDLGASAVVTNSTLHGVSSTGDLVIAHSTIVEPTKDFTPAFESSYSETDPSTGCVTRGSAGTVALVNTILDGPCLLPPTEVLTPPVLPPPDCQLSPDAPPPAMIVSIGGNLESGGDTCGLVDATDLVSVGDAELALAPLADNGGPTPTFALLPGSVAIDSAEPTGCTGSDQRGTPRPQGSGCDRGAVESVPEPSVGSSAYACGLALSWLAGRRRARSGTRS